MDNLTNEELEMAKKFEESQPTIESTNEIVEHPNENKTVALKDVDVNKLNIKLDKNKDFEEQAEDIVNAMAIGQATADEKFIDNLADKKKETIKDKADTKSNIAKSEKTESETQKSKANFNLNETVFNAFSIRGHLTEKASKIVLPVFTICYLIVSFIFGLPFMILQVILNNLDGLFCRYENINAQSKPRVRISFWVLLGLSIVAIIVVGSLAGCGII